MIDLSLPQEWHTPPNEFSLAPFWFWNDTLEEQELLRQMDEFQAHGIDAFVIHPRVGLPRDMGWMSSALLQKMHIAIEAAKERDMWVILYDEGMYPSGSSSGQVVAENPAFQCRGLVRIDLDAIQPNTIVSGITIDETGVPDLTTYQTLVAIVDHYAIMQRPVNAVIRGLHFIDPDANGQDPAEDTPLAIDLLNPDAVQCFIRLVYERYFHEFGDYFGTVIQAIFTDEPMLLGRLNETGIIAGTVNILQDVNAYLGYDFTPYLPLLWDNDCPKHIKQDYERALEHRLQQTYYAQLHDWCKKHTIKLTGHPAEPDDTRNLRYFHIPGQDIVWRFIEPDKPSALEGRQSTQAKATSSLMTHTNRRRNANEFCGAYGHELTFEEMCWLANWLLIRGCNLLIPHAFYYSVRGARYYERPPDVGLHSQWWDDGFTAFAHACRRLSWLNTDSQHVCHVVILGEHHNLPYQSAKTLFQNQIDFNYLTIEDLEQGMIIDNHLVIASQQYKVLIIEDDFSNEVQMQVKELEKHVSVIYWSDREDVHIRDIKKTLPSSPFNTLDAIGVRIRQVKKIGYVWTIVFNETSPLIDCELTINNALICDPFTMTISKFNGRLQLQGHEIQVFIQKDILN